MKLYLKPGSINCVCCPDIPYCRNLPKLEKEEQMTPTEWLLTFTGFFLAISLALIGVFG